VFTEDLAQFFDQSEFAVAVVIKNGATTIRTISGIFNTPEQDVAIFDANVEANLPFVQCMTSALAGVTHAHTMTIDSTVYRISNIASDGTGVSTVQLRK
jgi:alcohol dehydrogenase class IV